MGQRLNLEIEMEGMTIANCYYHWSGFTGSSAELAQEALDARPEEWNKLFPAFQAAEMLIATGGSLDYASRAAINEFVEARGKNFISETLKKNMGMEAKLDRNSGLISIVSMGMFETRAWEEARVVLDVTNEVVRFGAIWKIREKDYDEEELEEISGSAVDLGNEFDLKKIPFSDFPKFKEKILSMISDNQYNFRCGGNLYTMIE